MSMGRLIFTLDNGAGKGLELHGDGMLLFLSLKGEALSNKFDPEIFPFLEAIDFADVERGMSDAWWKR